VLPREFHNPLTGKVSALSWLILVLVAVMAVSHAVQVWTLFIPSSLFKTYHLCMAALFLSLISAQQSSALWRKALHLCLATIAIACMIYIFVSFDALISERMFGPSDIDVVVGILLLITVIIGE